MAIGSWAWPSRQSTATNADSGNSYVDAVVDVANNEVVSMFDWTAPEAARTEIAGRRVWFSTQVLFAEGTRTLKQETISTRLEGGGVQITQGSRLRVLDTATGRVVAANDDAPVGVVSPLFCRGGSERVVVAGERKMHLIELNTLRPIKAMSVPFAKYWVF